MSYKVSLLTSKKARPFPNITPAWEKEIAPQNEVSRTEVASYIQIWTSEFHKNFISVSVLWNVSFFPVPV